MFIFEERVHPPRRKRLISLCLLVTLSFGGCIPVSRLQLAEEVVEVE